LIVPSTRALKVGGALALASLLGVLDARAGWAIVGALVALSGAVLIEGRGLPADALRTRRRFPARLSFGEPEPLVEEVRSEASFPLEVRLTHTAPADVTLAAASAPRIVLPARGAAEVRLTLLCRRRGERRLPRAVARYGRPGGLARRQVAVGAESVLAVSPNVARLRRYEVLRQMRALAAIGMHRTRYLGLGSEFDHLRAYRRGDDLRRIHWKATARRGFPITQAVRVERGQSVLIAVDVSHWMGVSAGSLSRLDHAVDAALFLAHVARRAGDQVGLALFAHEVVSFVAPSARPGQTRRLLDVLALAQPRAVHASYRNLARHLLARRLRRSLVVVISEPPDPEAVREMAASLLVLRSRHLLLAVGLEDPALAAARDAPPGDVLALCRRLAAGELYEERRQRFRALGESGLNALDVVPQELSVAVVNRYLELKARGAL
jgi:uncharacterized protein (DUF58 family)